MTDEANGSYGPRCMCGHYRSEHDRRPARGVLRSFVCRGAYATLAADADDTESVEVKCFCQGFSEVADGYHVIR